MKIYHKKNFAFGLFALCNQRDKKRRHQPQAHVNQGLLPRRLSPGNQHQLRRQERNLTDTEWEDRKYEDLP